MLFYSLRDKGDAETAVFVVVVGAAIAGEFDGGTHFLKDLKVVVEAAFGDADLVGTVGGFAGGFEMDKIVEADQAMQ